MKTTKSSNARLCIFIAGTLLSFLTGTVDAGAMTDGTVYCHPEAPDLCVGRLDQSGPSPFEQCYESTNGMRNCTDGYMGGYSFTWTFVEGLENGTDTYDIPFDVFEEEYATGLKVSVKVDDDNNCLGVTVGNDTCTSCTVCEEKNISYSSYTDLFVVSADCTNLENGRVVECGLMKPFFYPFELATDDSQTPNTGESTTTKGETSEEPAQDSREIDSAPSSAAAISNAHAIRMVSFLAVLATVAFIL